MHLHNALVFVLQTAVKHYDTEYIMRADDDSYLNIPVIMHMLQQQRTEGPGRAFWCGFPAALAFG